MRNDQTVFESAIYMMYNKAITMKIKLTFQTILNQEKFIFMLFISLKKTGLSFYPYF